jgi:hypothetical protein
MTDLILTQQEGDELFAMAKVAVASDPVDLPDFGGRAEFALASKDRREEFVINFTRNHIKLSKRSHHLRGRKVFGLCRLCLDGSPHRNPDGEELGARHMHIYRQGFGLKFAVDLPDGVFRDLDDGLTTIEDFMRYCNVVELPNFRRSLFTT